MLTRFFGGIAFVVICFSVNAASRNNSKVVYGDDSRVYDFQHTNPLVRSWGHSVAAIVSNHKMEWPKGQKVVRIYGDTLSSGRGLCKDTAFSEDHVGADCSAFLIGDDLVASAGHCLNTQAQCDNFSFVFDFNKDLTGNRSWRYVSAQSVFKCAEIVQASYDQGDNRDFTIVRLDRSVGRRPFPIARAQLIPEEKLTVIGFPDGLPKVISSGAKVLKEIDELTFAINSDTFAGNSGSPVIGESTGLVYGILIRGEFDYVYDYDRQCGVVKKCLEDGSDCDGEEVFRLGLLPEVLALLDD